MNAALMRQQWLHNSASSIFMFPFLWLLPASTEVSFNLQQNNWFCDEMANTTLIEKKLFVRLHKGRKIEKLDRQARENSIKFNYGASSATALSKCPRQAQPSVIE